MQEHEIDVLVQRIIEMSHGSTIKFVVGSQDVYQIYRTDFINSHCYLQKNGRSLSYVKHGDTAWHKSNIKIWLVGWINR